MTPSNVYLIIPVYNEAQVLAGVLKELSRFNYNIIVVDDGSEDETSQILAYYPVTVLRHLVNLGQGAALQTGMDWAKMTNAEVVVHFDSDGQHTAADIEKLIAPILLNEGDIVIGSRFLSQRSKKMIPFARRFFLKIATYVEWPFTGMKLTDAHNGLRALNRFALERIELTENRMAHATELIAQARKQKLRIKEVPVNIRYTTYTKRKGQSMLNGLYVLFSLFLKKLTK